MLAPLHHVIYHSQATTTLDESDLTKLLQQARAWNTSHQITGLLLYNNGNIMQVLEGSEQEVRYIFDRISRDQRHFGVMKLADGPIQARNFSRWSMAFTTVTQDNFLQLAGYRPDRTSSTVANGISLHDHLHSLLSAFVIEDEVRL